LIGAFSGVFLIVGESIKLSTRTTAKIGGEIIHKGDENCQTQGYFSRERDDLLWRATFCIVPKLLLPNTLSTRASPRK
jgi:hypothetical protein